jgi:hypothetical protein
MRDAARGCCLPPWLLLNPPTAFNLALYHPFLTTRLELPCSYGAYAQVCGEGHEVEGDGVVPLRSALLQGADQTVINGVFHRWLPLPIYFSRLACACPL